MARHPHIFGPVGAYYVGSREAADGSVLFTKTGPKRPVLSLFGGGRRSRARYCYIRLITRRFMVKKKGYRTLKSHQTIALERIADSLERISSYLCAIEMGLAKSYQKPINVFMEMESEE